MLEENMKSTKRKWERRLVCIHIFILKKFYKDLCINSIHRFWNTRLYNSFSFFFKTSAEPNRTARKQQNNNPKSDTFQYFKFDTNELIQHYMHPVWCSAIPIVSYLYQNVNPNQFKTSALTSHFQEVIEDTKEQSHTIKKQQDQQKTRDIVQEDSVCSEVNCILKGKGNKNIKVKETCSSLREL